MPIRSPLPMLALLPILTTAVGCSSEGRHPPVTAENLDLSRYAGHWYEIARIPHARGNDCVDTTTDITPLAGGRFKVVTACTSTRAGKQNQTEGTATVVDRANHSKLLVHSGAMKGNYWIFWVDPDYTLALVGTPALKNLWVLARHPSISGQEYEALLQIASDKGFDTSAVRRTEQHQRPGD